MIRTIRSIILALGNVDNRSEDLGVRQRVEFLRLIEFSILKLRSLLIDKAFRWTLKNEV